MRPHHSIAICLLLLGTSACAVAVEDPGPECLPEESYCLDSYTISSCYGGRFVADDCEEVCFDAGFPYSTGCGYDPGVGYDACYCQ